MKRKNQVNTLFLFLCLTWTGIAQTPTNFAGQWEYDKVSSKPGIFEDNYPGTKILQINQNASTLSYLQIYKQPGSADFKTTTETFYLDGKERIEKKSSDYMIKRSTKWSADKKALTLTYIDIETREGKTTETVLADTYKLSSDGRTMTVDRYSKSVLKGEMYCNFIYHRK